EQALEKEASLASDPVLRLELRYSLARLYESRKDMAAAEKNFAALYRENPRISGVVRSTVDFYWRTKSYAEAIRVLEESAKSAYPELAKQFAFEAGRKSTAASRYAHARELLTALLKDSPYDSQYLAAMADTYGQAGDQPGLKQFYMEKIAAFRSAALPAEVKKTDIATLRRGLVPALTRPRDKPTARDHYTQLI